MGSRLWNGRTVVAVWLVLLSGHVTRARELTLGQAWDIGLKQSARGGIINGNLEVAEQNYRAKRINFYLPEISINGALPSYDESRNYDFAPGANRRSLIERSDLGLESFIRLKQSLILGGDLEIRANLTANDERYPSARYDGEGGLVGGFMNEESRRSFFNFSYAQPLLKPSENKYALNNRRDDYDIAQLTFVEEQATLRREITEAYLGVMQAELVLEKAKDEARSGELQAEMDSTKFLDGVIAEENWLESASARLDAELSLFEAQTDAGEKRRALAQLLDLDDQEQLALVMPETDEPLSAAEREQLTAAWETTLAIQRAELQYRKQQRAADYASSSHGLTGDLALSYSFGRGQIDETFEDFPADVEDINTNSWGVALNFTLPLWDGGASGAAVQASQHEAERYRLELRNTRRGARADLINVINRLEVAYQRLEIVRKQIDLAKNRMDIAWSRFEDGQISELTYLESRIFYLETKDRYLEELKGYLLNRIELEGKYAG